MESSQFPPAVHRKRLVGGFSCARFDCAAILKINAADNFEIVVQVYRLRRILNDEISCAASEQIEIRSYIIYFFERMAEVLHNLTAHAADTAQDFLSPDVVKLKISFSKKRPFSPRKTYALIMRMCRAPLYQNAMKPYKSFA